ncbi:hypothetical protein [Flagellimonas marinaquae]
MIRKKPCKNGCNHKMRFFTGLFVLCAALSFTDSRAQSAEIEGELAIGAKVGIGFSQFSQPGNVVAATAGGFVRRQFLPYLQAEGGLSFDLYGGGRADMDRDLGLLSGQSSFYGANGNISRLQYLNRQVLLHAAKAHVSARLGLPELKDAPMVPKLIVGGSGSYIFRAVENHDSYFVFTDNTSIILSNQWENVGGDYDSFDFAVHFGFALDFKMRNGQIFSLEIIYEKGLKDINNIMVGQPANITELRVQRLGFNFAYTIF